MSPENVAPKVVQFRLKEASSLNLWKRYATRRHRKNHERIEAERARQKALAGQDVEAAGRDVAQGPAAGPQGMFGHGTSCRISPWAVFPDEPCGLPTRRI